LALPKKFHFFLISSVSGLLAGCATPEQRVRSALTDAGLSLPMAGCMAERMVDRLSLLQLRRLQSLSGLAEADIAAMTVQKFLYHVRAFKDPEILSVVTAATASCALRQL
jgi:hypothetical protein